MYKVRKEEKKATAVQRYLKGIKTVRKFSFPLDKPKSLWYNKDKIKERQQNRNKVVGRAKRLLIA